MAWGSPSAARGDKGDAQGHIGSPGQRSGLQVPGAPRGVPPCRAVPRRAVGVGPPPPAQRGALHGGDRSRSRPPGASRAPPPSSAPPAPARARARARLLHCATLHVTSFLSSHCTAPALICIPLGSQPIKRQAGQRKGSGRGRMRGCSLLVLRLLLLKDPAPPPSFGLSLGLGLEQREERETRRGCCFSPFLRFAKSRTSLIDCTFPSLQSQELPFALSCNSPFYFSIIKLFATRRKKKKKRTNRPQF